MKIAYVINSVEGGGGAQPVPAIARVLRGAGAQVRVFALSPRDRRSLPAMEKAGLDPLVREGGRGDHLAAFFWMKREIRNWGATHIWTSLSRATIMGLILGPHMGLPVISWQHNAFLKPWNERLLRLLQGRACLWVADSHSVARLTADRLGVSEDRLICWPIFAANPDMPVAQPWRTGQRVRVGSLGRLHPAKGYDVLIAALARLRAQGYEAAKEADFIIAGEGAQRESLEAQARSCGIDTIRFQGYAENPHDFLSTLHLYVQPSRAEGFCIAAHEAMVAGLPVIASAVGELAYSVQPRVTGVRVKPEDVDDLADAIRFMLDDSAARARMGRAARAEILDKFSWARFEAIGTSVIDRLRMTSD